jgi:putative transposase
MQAIKLIAEACLAGAIKREACKLLGVSMRTIERWEKHDDLIDKRKQAIRSPVNKLSEVERNTVLAIANSKTYQNLPPCKIVPMLADEGYYVASESNGTNLRNSTFCLPCTNTEPSSAWERLLAYV